MNNFIENIKRYTIYRLKMLEIALSTWKNRRAISRAYVTRKPLMVFPAVLFKRVVRVGLIVGGCTVVLLAFVGGIRVLKKYAPLLQAVSVSKPKPPEKLPVPKIIQDTIAKVVVDTTPEVSLVDTSSGITAFSFGNLSSALVADKQGHMLYLLNRTDSSWKIEKKWNVAIGERNGPKQKNGDKRTPEGVYFIVGRRERSELSNIYGPLSYMLDYPNEDDVREGKTGQGIWIHGTAPDTSPYVTRGCLELENKDIAELGSILRAGIGTPVIIVGADTLGDPIAYVDITKLLLRRRKVFDQYVQRFDGIKPFLNQWRLAWESREIGAYSSCYDSLRFSTEGLSVEAWRERKQSIFNAVSSLSVTLSNVILTDWEDSIATVKFIQFYETDRVQVSNGKRLVLIRTGDTWKIIRETAIPRQEYFL
jgi:murein L,D-transpeptidase YafK